MFDLFFFFRAAKNLICSFGELRSASGAAAQIVHTMCYIKTKIILGEHHLLNLRGVGPPAWGDYDVYLVQCKFLSSFHRCILDIKKLASMTSVNRSSCYHCVYKEYYKGSLVVSQKSTPERVALFELRFILLPYWRFSDPSFYEAIQFGQFVVSRCKT